MNHQARFITNVGRVGRRQSKYDYRIRRCIGHEPCWILVFLRDDQTEIESFEEYTSYSIDRLLAAHAKEVAGKHGEIIYGDLR